MSNNIECFWLKFLINVLKMFFLLQKLPSGTILKINILSRLSLSNYLSLDITSNDHRKLLHHCHRITNRKLAKKNTILRSNSQIKSTAEYWFNYFSHPSENKTKIELFCRCCIFLSSSLSQYCLLLETMFLWHFTQTHAPPLLLHRLCSCRPINVLWAYLCDLAAMNNMRNIWLLLYFWNFAGKYENNSHSQMNANWRRLWLHLVAASKYFQWGVVFYYSYHEMNHAANEIRLNTVFFCLNDVDLYRCSK